MVESKTRHTTSTRSGAPRSSPMPGRPITASSSGAGNSDAAPRRNVLPLVWSILFLVGGGLILYTLPNRSEESVPDVWDPAATGAVVALKTDVRSGGEQQGDLLRLTWPAHPEAESYRVQFAANGIAMTPVEALGNVFLYDLKSNVLGLPSQFTWQVTAVMADGSEVVSPMREYSLE